MPDGRAEFFPTDTAPWIWPLVLDRLRSANEPIAVVGNRRPPTDDDLITQDLLRSCPFGVVIGDVRGRVRGANDAFLAITDRDQSLLDAGFVHWDDLTPEEHLAADHRAIDQAVLTGQCEPYEKELIRRDGRHIPVRVSFAVLDLPAGLIAAYAIDLSKSRETEANLAAAARRRDVLLEVSEAAIAGSLDRVALTDFIFEKASALLHADLWACYRQDAPSSALTLVSARGSNSALLPQTLLDVEGRSRTQAANAAIIAASASHAAINVPGEPALGPGAASGHPLVDTEGRLLGTFTVCTRTRDSFEPDEVEFIHALVHTLGLAWQRFNAEEKLRDSGAKLRLAMQSAGIGIWERDRVGNATNLARGGNWALQSEKHDPRVLALQQVESLPQPMLPIFRGMLGYCVAARSASYDRNMEAAVLSGRRSIVERQHGFLRNIMAEHLHEKGFLVLSAAEVAAGLGMLLMEEPVDLFISDMSSPGLHASALAKEAAIRSRIKAGGKVFAIHDLAAEADLMSEGRCLFLPGHICLPLLAASAAERSARSSRK